MMMWGLVSLMGSILSVALTLYCIFILRTYVGENRLVFYGRHSVLMFVVVAHIMFTFSSQWAICLLPAYMSLAWAMWCTRSRLVIDATEIKVVTPFRSTVIPRDGHCAIKFWVADGEHPDEFSGAELECPDQLPLDLSRYDIVVNPEDARKAFALVGYDTKYDSSRRSRIRGDFQGVVILGIISLAANLVAVL